ncbi:MAG: FecR domain-containing protein [Bacteroidales bacterium]|nr:FecR domain-containing protein [Bacteroidales bacterium]
MKNNFEHIDWDNFVGYYSGSFAEEEKQKFESWLKENAKHQYLYDSFVHVFKNKKSFQNAQKIDVELALNKIKGTEKLPKVFRLKQIWQVAASILLVIGLSLIVRQWVRNSDHIVVETKEKERIVKILEDGSEITMNENSKIWYARKFDKNRSVKLEGEAYFKIAHDSLVPFIVNMNNNYVKVLGTEFNIDNYNKQGSTIVTVTDGTVEFGTNMKSGMRPVILNKGEECRLNKNTMHYSILEKPYSNQAAWKTKHLIFKNTLLVDLAEEIEKVYFIHISVDDKIKNRKVSAIYHNQTLEGIFQILESTLDVQINTLNTNSYEIVMK